MANSIPPNEGIAMGTITSAPLPRDDDVRGVHALHGHDGDVRDRDDPY